MSNYIISIKRTRKDDEFITLWRPNNNGYTQALIAAGQYPNPEKGYHDSENSFPISEAVANSISILAPFDGRENVRVIPNTKEVWMALNQPEMAKKIKKSI